MTVHPNTIKLPKAKKYVMDKHIAIYLPSGENAVTHIVKGKKVEVLDEIHYDAHGFVAIQDVEIKNNPYEGIFMHYDAPHDTIYVFRKNGQYMARMPYIYVELHNETVRVPNAFQSAHDFTVGHAENERMHAQWLRVLLHDNAHNRHTMLLLPYNQIETHEGYMFASAIETFMAYVQNGIPMVTDNKQLNHAKYGYYTNDSNTYISYYSTTNGEENDILVYNDNTRHQLLSQLVGLDIITFID